MRGLDSLEVFNMAKKEIDGVVVEAKSILTALKIIKTVCEDNGVNCESCPMYGNQTCLIHDSEPDNWHINDTGDVWRALL